MSQKLKNFDLQLPVQSLPITIKVVSLNPAHGDMYSLQHYMIVAGWWFSQVRVFQFPPPWNCIWTLKSKDCITSLFLNYIWTNVMCHGPPFLSSGERWLFVFWILVVELSINNVTCLILSFHNIVNVHVKQKFCNF
jgi:hypothetical protein